jgi:hypothetical protein
VHARTAASIHPVKGSLRHNIAGMISRRSTSRFLKTDDRLARYRDDAFQAVIGRKTTSVRKNSSFSEEEIWPVIHSFKRALVEQPADKP